MLLDEENIKPVKLNEYLKDLHFYNESKIQEVTTSQTMRTATDKSQISKGDLPASKAPVETKPKVDIAPSKIDAISTRNSSPAHEEKDG